MQLVRQCVDIQLKYHFFQEAKYMLILYILIPCSHFYLQTNAFISLYKLIILDVYLASSEQLKNTCKEISFESLIMFSKVVSGGYLRC